MTAVAARPTTRILGIDPGSRITGFGLIETSGSRNRCLAHDVIRLGEGPLPGRLLALMRALRGLCAELRPDEVAIEQVFVCRNTASALVLGEARGVAVCAVAEAGLPLHEYAPASIKQAITGSGRAEKPQIQRMVRALLNLPAAPSADAADALACALCHAHSRSLVQRHGVLREMRR
jgi:crossover junction endodeoxyribonuclease RuvC